MKSLRAVCLGLLAVCVSNAYAEGPATTAIEGAERYRIELADIGPIRIEHFGGGWFVREQMTRVAVSAEEALQSPERHERLVAFIMENLCGQLDSGCGDSGDTIVKVNPEFVGFRFDQFSNTNYVPSYLVTVSMTKDGRVLKEIRVGGGNLKKKGKMKKVKIKAKYGYRHPQHIVDDARVSLGNLEYVIDLVHEKVVQYLVK